MEAAHSEGRKVEEEKGRDCWNKCDFPEQCRYMGMLENGADMHDSRRTSTSSSSSSSYSDAVSESGDRMIVDQEATAVHVPQQDVEMTDVDADGVQENEIRRPKAISPGAQSSCGNHRRRSSFLEHLDCAGSGVFSTQGESSKSVCSKIWARICKRLRSLGARAARVIACLGPDVFLLHSESDLSAL